jgi:hypothetical protein
MKVWLPVRLVAVLLALGPLASAGSAGAALDLWSEAGIEVDVTAGSAVEARTIAIERAQRSGLVRLLRRLADANDVAKIPDVATLPIDAFVRGYAVEEEKRSATRYIGRLTVHFREDRVRDLLERAGIAAVLEPSRPLLLVPVVAEIGDQRLAGELDPWRAAWLAELERNTVVQLVLPLGDLSDIAQLQGYVAGGDPQALLGLAARYGLAAATVARAEVVAADDAGEPVRLSLTLTTAGDWPEVREAAVLDRQAQEDAAAFWRRAAVLAKSWLDAAWKRDNLVRSDLRDRVAVVVPLADLAGWIQIKRGLESVPEIRSLELVRLTREQAELAVEFVGGRARLERRLVERGLQPMAENGRWRLRPAGAGAGR